VDPTGQGNLGAATGVATPSVARSDRSRGAARIPGLDGLRALAVTGVLLYHGGLAAAPGGFLGVDLFFVLSGFLITTLLLTEARRAGTVDVVAFWSRRVRRLLPGLALVSVTTVVVFTGFSASSDSDELRGDALAALLYGANWHFLATSEGYFDRFDTPSPLLHTWSLAIEEQFYVVWPLLLLLALTIRLRRRALAAVVATAALASAGWMAHLAAGGAGLDRLHYGTDTRAHTILVGVVAALLLHRTDISATKHRKVPLRLGRVASAVAAVALLAVGAAMCLVDAEDGRLHRGGLLAFAVLCAVLIAAVVLSLDGVATRVLEWWPVRAVGVLSYSLYLWHWPVFLYLTGARTSLTGTALLSVRIAVTLVLAVVSYHLVEMPLRRSSWRPRHLLAMPVGAAAVACGLLVGASVVAEGVRTPAGLAERQPVVAVAEDAAVPTIAAAPPRPSPGPGPSAPVRTPPGLQVTVLGDSTALTLADGLRDRPGRRGVTWHNAAMLGCGLTAMTSYRYMGELDPWGKKHCRGIARKWRHRVTAHPADVVAVLVGRWEVTDRFFAGRWTHVGQREFDAYLTERLHAAVDAASATGATVAFLTAPYYSRGEQPNGSRWPEDDPRRVDAFNRLLRSVAAAHPNVEVVEFGRRMSGGARSYVAAVDGILLRYDGVHFTQGAADWVQPWLEAQLARVHERTETG
jgi:peptidoglycan/LPS O-acetylase OafA/YrhL